MKERPILFSAPMVRVMRDAQGIGRGTLERLCPYGWPGDRLWVRETFATGDGVGMGNMTATEARNG